MNLSYGYQLHQAERTMTRGEILAADALRGRGAAAARRGPRSAGRKARDRGTMVLSAIMGRTARTAARAA